MSGSKHWIFDSLHWLQTSDQWWRKDRASACLWQNHIQLTHRPKKSGGVSATQIGRWSFHSYLKRNSILSRRRNFSQKISWHTVYFGLSPLPVTVAKEGRFRSGFPAKKYWQSWWWLESWEGGQPKVYWHLMGSYGVFPKIQVFSKMDGLQWKVLFFNGWVGGFSHPYFWFNTHIKTSYDDHDIPWNSFASRIPSKAPPGVVA